MRNDIKTTSQAHRTHVDAQHLATRDHVTLEASRIQENFELGRQTDALRKEQEKLRSRILSTLWFPEMNARENDIQEVPEETVRRIFEKENEDAKSKNADLDFYPPDSAQQDAARRRSSQFRQWLEADDPIFWISGKAGSGKSTLMKFLVQDQRTKDCLDKWGPNVMICRYFFIELGENRLQRQFRGCLRALLHQIFASKPHTLDLLLQIKPRLKPKQSEHDWSLEELRDYLLEALRVEGSRFCLFLDGLDEMGVRSEDRDSMIDLVKKLSDYPNVKVCVSSRPENLFQQTLGLYPCLQTETLTKSAIKVYVWKCLAPHKPYIPTDLRSYRALVESLVNNASGVFLWVRLATKSVIDGIRNGDSWDTLYKRTQELEPDLYRLFQQMWERQNANQHYYKEETARLLWYALHAHTNGGRGSQLDTVTGFILGTHETLLSDIMLHLKVTTFAITEEKQILKEYEKWLSARSAGLLEIHGIPANTSMTSVNPLLSGCKVNFIHRSVTEFLLSTKQGHEILLVDGRSTKERLLHPAEIMKQICYYKEVGGFMFSHYTNLITSLTCADYITSQEATKHLLDFRNLVQPREPQQYSDFHLFMQAAQHGNVGFLSQQHKAFEALSLEEKSSILNYASVYGLDELGWYHPIIDLEHRVVEDKSPSSDVNRDMKRLGSFRDTIKWLLLYGGAHPNAKCSEIKLGFLTMAITPFHVFLSNDIYWRGNAGYLDISRAIISDWPLEFEHHKLDWTIPFYFYPFYNKTGCFTEFRCVGCFAVRNECNSIFITYAKWLSEFFNRVKRPVTPDEIEFEIAQDIASVEFDVQCIAVREVDESRLNVRDGWQAPDPEKSEWRREFEAVIGKGFLRWIYSLPDEYEHMEDIITNSCEALCRYK